MSVMVGNIPFYTIDTNPQICSGMKGSQTCNKTWRVNATGVENSTYDFYGIITPNQYTTTHISLGNLTVTQTGNTTVKIVIPVMPVGVTVDPVDSEKATVLWGDFKLKDGQSVTGAVAIINITDANNQQLVINGSMVYNSTSQRYE